MLTALRSGGLRFPNCSTCSTSFTMRRVSSTIRSVSSRSSPSRFIDRSCAAPVMPASGFLISCASIAAMPMADFAADLAECARFSRSAVERVSMRRRTKPGIPIMGAIWMLHWTGGFSPEETSTLLMKRSAWSVRTRRKLSSMGASMASLSKTGAPLRERAEVLRKDLGGRVDLGDDVVGVEEEGRDGERAPELVAEGDHAASAKGERAAGRSARTRGASAVRTSRRRSGGGGGFVDVPAEVLAGDAGAEFGAVEGERVLVVFGDEVGEGLARGGGGGRAAREAGGDLGEDPRAALRAAADHDARRAGGVQRGAGGFGGGDVAVRDDRDRHGLGDAADRGPVGGALVELAAGAAVDGDHADAGGLGAAGEIGGVVAGVVPAEAGLEGDGDLHGLHHRLDQRQRVIEVAQERGAGPAVRHLLRRAAHVDVDDPRAHGFDHAGGLAHPVRLASRELDGGVGDPCPEFGAFARAGAGADDLLARHHLAHHEARAEAGDDAAERQVA